MATGRTAGTAASGRARPVAGLSYTLGANLPLEARAGGGEGVHGDVFVDVNGLGVLAEVIEAGEAAGAVALERSLAGVFPMIRQLLEGCLLPVERLASPEVGRT